MGIRIGDLDRGLGLEIGICDWNWGLELGIGIGNWDFELRLGLGIRIGDLDWVVTFVVTSVETFGCNCWL